MFKKSVLVLATLLALTSFAGPALARQCQVLAVPGLTMFTCVLPANSAHHFIHVGSGSYVTVEVVDRHTLVGVFKKRAGFWGLQKTITGLYGNEYYAVATKPQVPVSVAINND